MRCNKCGEKLRTGDSYCPICGEKYVEPKKTLPPKTKFFVKIEDSPGGWGIYCFIAFLGMILSTCIAFIAGVLPVALGYDFNWLLFILTFIFPFALTIIYIISELDTLEVIDGKTIKITRFLKRKTEYYEISNISYISDYLNFEITGRGPFIAYNKEGDELFSTINTFDLYKVFDYYGIEMRLHHGVHKK